MRPASVSASAGEDWRQTFAGMMLFGCLMLLSTIPLRAAASGPIVAGIRNCALVFLGVSLPLYGWQSARRRSAVADGPALWHTTLLFANAAAALGAILLLRAAALKVHYIGCVSALDLAGGLLLPAAAGIALVMLPYISRTALRNSALVGAAGCRAATMTFAIAGRAAAAGGVRGTTAAAARRAALPLTAQAAPARDHSTLL
jgi:hypothetical protein